MSIPVVDCPTSKAVPKRRDSVRKSGLDFLSKYFLARGEAPPDDLT